MAPPSGTLGFHAGRLSAPIVSMMPFPTTQWSLIATAALDDDPAGHLALGELCRRYRGPVLSFFRSKCLSSEDAEDLTQSLFEQLLKHRLLLRADGSKGRFRNYLLAVADNAYRTWRTAAGSLKRGSGIAALSLEQLAESNWEPAGPDDESTSRFDQEWALSVISATWRNVEDEYTSTPHRAARFAVLRRFLPGHAAAPTYEAAASELGIAVDHVKTLIYRLRNFFRSAIRKQIADTLLSREDLDDEMNYLHEVMARQPSHPDSQAFSDRKKQVGVDES
jgi:DNA-directed RNA polymerase specialized sigma24 family protein